MDSIEAQEIAPPTTHPLAPWKYSKRVLLKTILERDDGGLRFLGEKVVVGGWVKSSKEVKVDSPPPPPMTVVQDRRTEPTNLTCAEILGSRLPFFKPIIKVFCGSSQRPRPRLEAAPPKPLPSIAFLQVSDGSCVATLQVVVESSLAPPNQVLATGTCILVEGTLRQPLTQGKHAIELRADKVIHIGTVDSSSYVFAKKRLPLDMLRSCLHFRPRTTTVASVMRIRSSLSFATHTFFRNHGFLDVQVPIITKTDSEGVSEKLALSSMGSGADPKLSKVSDGVSLDVIKSAVKEKSARVEELKRTESNKEALAAAIQDLKKTNELVSQLEAREKSIPLKSDGPDSSGNSLPDMYLTVNGRLHLESYASALGNVYSFGPRFRAARTESPKQVAEMWMAETQMAFAELEGAMNCADDFFKFLCKWVLDNCNEDMKFVCKRIDKNSIHRLQSVISKPVVKITYAEAVESLSKVKDKMEIKTEHGLALTTEHLNYLCDEIYNSPIIIYNYPRDVKPFYVRLNDDGKTVAAFDMVVPKIGKLIEGSQNEERMNVLSQRIQELGLPREQYEWYIDLRRHGAVINSGFSFGFDLMILFATGLTDVRDVIPFPKSFGNRATD